METTSGGQTGRQRKLSGRQQQDCQQQDCQQQAAAANASTLWCFIASMGQAGLGTCTHARLAFACWLPAC
jgi:hypothetical protein